MRITKNNKAPIPIPHGQCLRVTRFELANLRAGEAPRAEFHFKIQNRNSNSISEFNFNGTLWIGGRSEPQAKVQAIDIGAKSTEWIYAGDQQKILEAVGDLFVLLLPGWDRNWRMLRMFELTGARVWLYVLAEQGA